MERAAGNPLFLRELASVGEKAHDAEDLPEPSSHWLRPESTSSRPEIGRCFAGRRCSVSRSRRR